MPFARDDVGLADEAIRAEGTERAGRFDALFGGVNIEFKRPGLLAGELPKRLEERAKAGESAAKQWRELKRASEAEEDDS